MSEPERTIAEFFRDISPWLAGAAGGIIDYINQIQRGEKAWSPWGFVIHVVSAVFFGYLAGSAAVGLEYPQGVAHAVCGLGGFLGTRIADLAMIWLNRDKK